MTTCSWPISAMVSNRASEPDEVASMVAREDIGIPCEGEFGEMRSARSAGASPSRLRVQLARDHDALNLGRAFIQLGHLRIAKEALNGVLLHVAIAAEDLHGLRRDPHGRLAREQLAHGAELRDRLATVLGRGRRVKQRTRRSHARGHVGELELNGPKLLDRTIELSPLGRITSRMFQRRPCDPDRLWRDTKP